MITVGFGRSEKYPCLREVVKLKHSAALVRFCRKVDRRKTRFKYACYQS